MNESWKPWRDGDYEVSDHGSVRRARPGRRTFVGRLLKPVRLRNGYLQVGPTVGGRNEVHYVHEMVAEVFLGPRPERADINHIDGNKTNNHVGNLEYTTHAGNMAHAAETGLLPRGERRAAARFTEADVRAIRERHSAGASIGALARELRASTATIFGIVHRRTWRHVE